MPADRAPSGPQTPHERKPDICDWCRDKLQPHQEAINGGCGLCDICRHNGHEATVNE